MPMISENRRSNEQVDLTIIISICYSYMSKGKYMYLYDAIQGKVESKVKYYYRKFSGGNFISSGIFLNLYAGR